MKEIHTKGYYPAGTGQYSNALKDIRADLLELKAMIGCGTAEDVKVNEIEKAVKEHERKFHAKSVFYATIYGQPQKGHTHLQEMQKPDPATRVDVYTFDVDARMEKYHFFSKPDILRIEQENLIEGGKVAVIIVGKRPFPPSDSWEALELITQHFSAWKHWEALSLKASSGQWFYSRDLQNRIANLRTIILKNKKKLYTQRDKLWTELKLVIKQIRELE